VARDGDVVVIAGKGHEPGQQFRDFTLAPPAWHDGGSTRFLLGTDPVGRDILSRLIHGTRLSLLIGVISVAISLSLGVALGLIAGYFRGLVETTIMRLMAAPYAETDVIIALEPGQTSWPYVEMTARLMLLFGAQVIVSMEQPGERPKELRVFRGVYGARDYTVEPGASKANHFMAGAGGIASGLSAVGDPARREGDDPRRGTRQPAGRRRFRRGAGEDGRCRDPGR